MKSKSSPPILAKECSVMTNVLKISLKLWPLFMSLTSLKMRKLLKIVMTPLIAREVFADMKMLITEPTMITKSNMFQASEK